MQIEVNSKKYDRYTEKKVVTLRLYKEDHKTLKKLSDKDELIYNNEIVDFNKFVRVVIHEKMLELGLIEGEEV